MPAVREHMSRELLTVEPKLTLADVAKRMVGRDVGAALVMEGDDLVGILTERDVLRAVAENVAGKASVSEWMTARPETIDIDETTSHAATLMLHGGFRHLPVSEHDAIVGMLSIRDLMRIALEDSAPRGV